MIQEGGGLGPATLEEDPDDNDGEGGDESSVNILGGKGGMLVTCDCLPCPFRFWIARKCSARICARRSVTDTGCEEGCEEEGGALETL